MSYVALPVAGSAGREVWVNPGQVVCLMDEGPRRTQIVTTGLSSAASITLVIALAAHEVVRRLEGAVALEEEAA